MAHHVADLIHLAEKGTEEDRCRCATAILELWKHKSDMPTRRRPFQEFEPVLRTLASLETNARTPRYFRVAQHSDLDAESDPESSQWLATAESIDEVARTLIRFCLGIAAQSAVQKNQDWLNFVEELEDPTDTMVSVARFASLEGDIASDTDAADKLQNELANRLRSLDTFAEFAQFMSNHLKQKLGETGDKPNDATSGETSVIPSVD
jgi:hypothetical protein